MGARPRRLVRKVLGIIGLLFVGCVAVCSRPCVPSFGGLAVAVVATAVDHRDEPRKRELRLEGGEHVLHAVFEASHQFGDFVAVSAHMRDAGTIEIRLERVLSTFIPMNCVGTSRYAVTIEGLEAGAYHVVVVKEGRELFAGDTEVRAAAQRLAHAGGRTLLRTPPCA